MPNLRPHPQPEQLPAPGVFAARIDDARLDVSKSSGADMLAMTITLLPSAGQVRAYLPFSARTRVVCERFCKSAGLIFPADGSEIFVEPNQVMGRFLYVEVGHYEWRGKLCAKVVKYLNRKQALAANPDLDEACVRGQAPVRLEAYPEIAKAIEEDDFLPF
jgi:hypothetical protein